MSAVRAPAGLTRRELDARELGLEARSFFAGFSDADGNPEAARRGRLLADAVVEIIATVEEERALRRACQARADRCVAILADQAGRALLLAMRRESARLAIEADDAASEFGAPAEADRGVSALGSDELEQVIHGSYAANGNGHAADAGDLDPSLLEESPLLAELDSLADSEYGRPAESEPDPASDDVARRYEFDALGDFLRRELPKAEPLLGKPGQTYLALGSLLMVYGEDGTSKSTLTVDAIAHLAAGRQWLGLEVPRAVRVLVIENEGPAALWQEKLAAKATTWDGDTSWTSNVFVYAAPWGDFSFASPTAREALNAFCDAHEIDLVAANPTLGLGVPGSGKPDETEKFVGLLVECGLKSTRAFWLLHHENKAGQISGDWGRHADTKVQLQKDGNQPRTKLIWEKTRWATLPTDDEPKACLLEWITETKSYIVVPIDTVGATDDEIRHRVDAYLADHPYTSTTTVERDVKGTGKRIRETLQRGDYATKSGPRGATLYALRRDSVALFDDETTE